MSEIMTIKIKGKKLALNEDDRFIDNGACVQCLTHGFGYDELSGRKRTSFVLTKKAVKEMDSACERIVLPSDYPYFVILFKLRLRKVT